MRVACGGVDPVGTMRLRITPSFSIESLGAQRRENAGGPPPSVVFHGRVSATGDIFFGVSGDQKSQGTNLSNIGVVVRRRAPDPARPHLVGEPRREL